MFAIQTAWNKVKTNGYQKRNFLFLKENVCSGYSLEAALSNVDDSFTLSRLMKGPKTFCDPARDEYSQLTFFCEIYRKRLNNPQAFLTSNPDIIQMLFDRITC